MQKGHENDLFVLVSDTARAIRTRADRSARKRGLTRAQWMVLARLERRPGMSQNELAEILECEPITVVRLVDRLEKRGLVERRADPADRRVRRLHLKSAAFPVLNEIKRERARLNARMTKGMKRQALAALTAGLAKIKANMAR